MLARVAGELNRSDGGGLGGSDWPGASTPPERDGSGLGWLALAGDEADAPVAPPPPAGAWIWLTWVESRLTIDSSWRIRSSSCASRDEPVGGTGPADPGLA